VPLEVARGLVPAGVGVVAVAPGRTAGGLLLARYEEPSTLRYGELLVLPALTRVRGRLGWWVSHAYVDSPASLAGGRAMWGVPKDLATFAWRDGGVALTGDDGTPLLDARWRAPRRTAALPARMATNGTTGGGDRRRFTGTGTLDVAPARVGLDVAAGAPFGALPLQGRRAALAGRADLRLRAPQVLA
jgi:acetoacetate decarboxylase